MSDLLQDLSEYLIAKNIGTGRGVDIFEDFSPDSPDLVIIVREYAGNPTTTGVDVLDRSVQISVRAPKDNEGLARSRIWEIFNLLDTPEDRVKDFREELVNDRWMVFYARQTPFKLAVDELGRPIFAFNAGVATYRD